MQGEEMKILVTGSEGMIGRKLCEILEVTNCDVIIKADKKTGQDLTDFRLCKELTYGVDQLYHVAGVKGSGKMTRERPADFFVPMLQMNTNILEAARLNGVKKILYVSSTAVTHDKYPGFAKEAGELQLETYKIQYGFDNWVVIRPNSVYGEYSNFDAEDGMFIESLMAKVKRGDNPVEVFNNGGDVRDFLYSGDAAVLIKDAMDTLKGKYMIGGIPHSTREVVNVLKGLTKFKVKYLEGISTMRVAEGSIRSSLTPLEVGIKKTWEWYNERCNNI
jgi:GDP-L-fucose synthase